ncbi:MAG TPA: hypothetical protein VMW24_11505 [Sedimentisphaerales bacterium]|nr:hypothetical protein [Sedimentisphaerales bacterium]
MLIKMAPRGLSNTKLKSCDDIIKELSEHKWTVKIRPRIMYQKLGDDTIFTNFADSNQALCEQLRPRFLTEDEKLPKENDLKERLDSLKNKISYKTPTDNNLLNYLSNLLLYKAFILDVMDQIKEIKSKDVKLEDNRKKKIDDKKEDIKKLDKNIQKNDAKIKQHDKTIKEEKEKIENSKEEKENAERELKDFEDGTPGFTQWNDTIKYHSSCIETAKEKLDKAESDETKQEIDKTKVDLERDRIDRNRMQRELEELPGYEEYEKLKDLDSFFADCEKLDYKVSVHIRFTRTMNALNAYTDSNFKLENIRKYRKPHQETGIADEFGRMIIKQRNLMKLERHKINRYVMWQDGGLYTTVFSDTKERPYERTKFGASPKPRPIDKDRIPIWNYSNCTDAYTLEQRIKDSSESFNKLIDNFVISTYANYYGVNNVLEIGEEKLLLEYPDDSKTKKLSIPISVESQDVEKTKAPLHVLIKNYENKMSSTIGQFSYKPLEIVVRPVSIDIKGLLYAIRKGQIAVQRNEAKAGFHSTMWSGKAVQAAGILAAWNGKLIAVDNASGHYRPNWYLLYKAWEDFCKQGVFHDQGMLGIVVAIDGNDATPFGRSEGFYANQFFKAKKFMELAKEGFKIGPTVNELDKHLNELSKIGTFEVIDQNKNDCVNVFKSPHMKSYHTIWGNEQKRKALACEFIMSMEYDWDKIIDNVKNSYKDFPAKGGKLLSRFLKTTENVFKKRTKEVKKRKKLNNEKYEEIKNKLKDATATYKKVASKILKKCPPEKDLRNLNKYRKNQRIKKDIGSDDLFELIKCISDIDTANEAYPKDVLDEKDQKKIDSWSKSVKNALNFTADKEAGLYTKEEMNGTREKGDIFLDKEEQKKEQNEEIKKYIDNLENGIDFSGEDKKTDEAKLLLVDRRIYEQQPLKKTQPQTTPQKKSQSTTAKEGVLLYCVRCEGDFDPTGWRPPGEPKLAVGSNCPNCKGYNPLKEKPMKDQGK